MLTMWRDPVTTPGELGPLPHRQGARSKPLDVLIEGTSASDVPKNEVLLKGVRPQPDTRTQAGNHRFDLRSEQQRATVQCVEQRLDAEMVACKKDPFALRV